MKFLSSRPISLRWLAVIRLISQLMIHFMFIPPMLHLIKLMQLDSDAHSLSNHLLAKTVLGALQALMISFQSFKTWTSWSSVSKKLAACACTSIGGVPFSCIFWCGTLQPIWVDATSNNLAAIWWSHSGSTLLIRKRWFWWRVCLIHHWFSMTYTSTSTSTY